MENRRLQRSKRFEDRIRTEITELAPGSRLPTDTALGRDWGMSRKTVEKVMGRLADEGLVVRLRGRGTFVAPLGEPSPSSAARPDAATQFADALAAAIHAGEYKSGEALPSVKTLSSRLHVSRSTVIRGLRLLTRRGETIRIGRTTWVGGLRQVLSHTPRRSEVLMLLRERSHLPEVFHSDRFASMAFRIMEEHLSMAGYLLRFGYVWELPDMYRRWRRTRRFPEGLIVYDTNDSAFSSAPLLSSSTPFERDTAEIPLLLDWAWGPRAVRRRHLYVFDHEQTSTAIAETLAQFIAIRSWSTVRVFADDAAFALPGTTWMFTNLLKLRAALNWFSPAVMHRLHIVPTRDHRARPVRTEPSFVDRARRELSRYRPTTLDDIRGEIQTLDTLEDAFIVPSSSEVWVFQCDRHAEEALRWAERRHVDVPQRLAIIGLENDPSRYHLGLTRVDPDWSTMGYLMAHALIGDFTVPTARGRVIESRARVVEKVTT